MNVVCVNCNNNTKGRGWSLQGYYGIWGIFCSDCYDLVSHDSYKQPQNASAYMMILLKQSQRLSK